MNSSLRNAARNTVRSVAALLCLGLLAPAALAERAKIYTCVDASGRTLTSDRPIPACNDREQRILDGVTGHQQGTRAPSYTAEERREMANKEQQRQAELKRQRDAQQKERVLLMRYPDQKAHDAAREKSKETVRSVIAGAQLRLEQLKEEKAKNDAEMEFYVREPEKTPPVLRRRVESNKKEITDQEQFIAGKREEEQRIDQQFDAELEELKVLWAR